MDKNNWTYKKLGEVASIKSGYTPSSSDLMDCGNIPYFKVGDMNNVGNEKYLQYSSSYVNDTFKSFPKGSIVFPKNGAAIATNKKRILKQLSVVDLNTAVLIPTQKENVEFLYYWISNIDFRDITRRGTVPTLDTKTLMKLDVPHPPLAEQERIVAELDLLSSIIEKKKAQLKELDQLAQSIFYTMFGDPITNEKGWEVKKLGEACKLMAGGDVPRERFSKEKTKTYSVPVFSNGIENCGLYGYTDIPKITEKSITISGRGTIGFVAKRKEPFYPIIRLIVVTPINDIDITYLEYYAISMHFDGNGVAIPQLTVPMIKNVPIPLPPLPLQQEFASKIEAIERQKTLIQQSIDEVQTLFDSRMDYWFG